MLLKLICFGFSESKPDADIRLQLKVMIPLWRNLFKPLAYGVFHVKDRHLAVALQRYIILKRGLSLTLSLLDCQ